MKTVPGAVIPWRLNSPISFHKLTSWKRKAIYTDFLFFGKYIQISSIREIINKTKVTVLQTCGKEFLWSILEACGEIFSCANWATLSLNYIHSIERCQIPVIKQENNGHWRRIKYSFKESQVIKYPQITSPLLFAYIDIESIKHVF